MSASNEMDFDGELLGLDIDLPEDLPVFPVEDCFDDYLSALGSEVLQQSSSDASVDPFRADKMARHCGISEAYGDSEASGTLPPAAPTGSGQNSSGSPPPGVAYCHGSPSTGPTARSPSADSAPITPPSSSGAAHRSGFASTSQLPGRGTQQSHPPPAPQWQPQGQHMQPVEGLPPVIELPSIPGASLPHPGGPSPALSLDFPLPDFITSREPEAGLAVSSAPWHASASTGQLGLNPGHIPASSHAQWQQQLMQTPASGMLDFSGQHAEDFPSGSDMRLGLDEPGAGGGSNTQANYPGSNDVPGTMVFGRTGQPQGQKERKSPLAGYASTEVPGHLATDDAAEMESPDEAKPGKPRQRRNRSERQQMLNKLAQQRYRERKKQKAADIERAAAELSGRMQQYNLVQQKHKHLSDRHQALQRQLAEKEAELTKARAAAAQGVAEVGSLEKELEAAEQLSSGLHQQVFQLRQHLAERGLQTPGVLPIVLPPEEAQQLEALVEGISSASARVQHLEGIDAWRLVKSGAPGSAGPSCSDGWESWVDVASSLALSPDQCRKIAHIRNQYVRKLEAIFGERQQLNMEAVGVMLPQDRGGSGPHLLSGQVENYVFLGFFQRARHTARLADTLEKLKQNLKAEQRAGSELDYITLRRILSPLQAAWLILQSYPRKCDCLAFSQAVCQLQASAQPIMPQTWTGVQGSLGGNVVPSVSREGQLPPVALGMLHGSASLESAGFSQQGSIH